MYNIMIARVGGGAIRLGLEYATSTLSSKQIPNRSGSFSGSRLSVLVGCTKIV